jgi:hypothetical protein
MAQFQGGVVMEDRQMLRPLTLPDLFDEVFSLYRKNFLLVFGIAGVAYIPFSVLLRLVLGVPPENLTEEQALGMLGTYFWTTMFFFLAAMLAEAALTKAIADRYLGQASHVLGAYGFVLQRLFSLLGTLILLGLAWVVGALTLIGWIFVFFWTIFVIPVFAIEDRAATDAFSRSRQLAKENWGRILLVGLLAGLILWIVGWGMAALTNLIFGTYAQGLQGVLAGTFEGLAQALVVPIWLTAFVLLYFDIRVRKEGFDLQVLAQEMAMRTGADLPPPAPPTPPSV